MILIFFSSLVLLVNREILCTNEIMINILLNQM